MSVRPIPGIEAKHRHELDPFFYPQSIAVIGAGQNPLKPNGIPLNLLSMFGYRGDVYPVNPKYERVGGLKCYPSIGAVDTVVDLAVIGVPAKYALQILEECAAAGVKSAIVFTSGFAEVGDEGRAAQEQMRKIAAGTGMRILGPNCLGILNYYNGNMASFFYNQERKNLVHPEMLSFITQSGGLGGIIYQMVTQLSIGFNYFVSTGNEADISFAEILEYLVQRDEVSIVAGYMEGLQGDGTRFVRACREALEKGKLVTMLKVGRTADGAAAAASHTGALVGEDAVYDGLFKQFGVPRADDVEQLNALITLYATGRIPRGKRMAIITISGGGGVVVADKCPEYGIEVVPLNEETREGLRQVVPSYGAVRNPVDLTSQIFVDTELFQNSIRMVMRDPDVDIGGFFYNMEMPDMEAAQKIIDIYNEVEKPLVIFTWPTGQDYAVEAKRTLIDAGVPVIENIPGGLWAISSLADWHNRAGKPFLYPAYRLGPEKEKALSVIRPEDRKRGRLNEFKAKKILEAYGIPVTNERVAATVDEAVRAAEAIGYPVALKILSPQIAHKTEAGGVALDLPGEEAVRAAFAKVMAGARAYNPDAAIEGVLVQEMLQPGLEAIVGIKNDPVFGPAIVFGLGGIFVEVLKDAATRVAPLTEADARSMIEEIKGRALLGGVRGKPARDIDALVQILLKVSRLADELGDEIEELDINPLIIHEEGKGAAAADALLILK